MPCNCPTCFSGHQSKKMKIRASLLAALLFVVIASPELFGLMQSLLGRVVKVAVGGVPTAAGLILHALVYGLISYGMMSYKTRVLFICVANSARSQMAEALLRHRAIAGHLDAMQRPSLPCLKRVCSKESSPWPEPCKLRVIFIRAAHYCIYSRTPKKWMRSSLVSLESSKSEV